MIKIKDLKIGDTETITLVVTQATIRRTKAGKEYLSITFFDGIDSISGNYWDWTSGIVPPINSIIDTYCQVGDWMGKKQLTIKSMSHNNTESLLAFMPKSEKDLGQVYKDAYAMALSIRDDTLREIVVGLFEVLQYKWLTAPGAKSIHHAYAGGALVHTYSVAKLAAAIAKETEGANEDLCIAGALLHDVGKLFTYRTTGIAIDFTDTGTMLDHVYIGAELVGNYAEHKLTTHDEEVVDTKIELLKHIILSHHGRKEFGSPVEPQCIEACIVHSADGIDAIAEQIRYASHNLGDAKWTDRLYPSNRQYLVPDWVESLLSSNCAK